jgi:hypothetical protein
MMMRKKISQKAATLLQVETSHLTVIAVPYYSFEKMKEQIPPIVFE